MTPAAQLLTSCGPDGVWRIPADARELTPAMFTATTTPPTLAEMQAFVGGYVELVRLPGVGLSWVDEEGKLKGYPINGLGTVLAQMAHALAERDYIAGPYLVTIGKAEPD